MSSPSDRKSTGRRTRASGAGRVPPAAAVPLVWALAVGPALALGGAPAVTVPIFATIALAALAVTGVDANALRRDRLVLAAAVLAGVSLFQLLPLPPGLLRALDPRSADLSAGVLAPFRADRASSWRPLSMDPGTGRADLQYLVGLVAAYLAARRLTQRGQGARVLGALLTAPFAVALLALVHAGFGLTKVYAVYTPVQADPPIVSPILNPNHLAALVAAGAVLWLGRAVGTSQLLPRVLSIAAVVLCALVTALSRSRGGIAVGAGTLALALLTLLWLKERAQHQRTQRLFTGVFAACLAVTAGAYVGWEALQTEFVHGDLTKLRFLRGALAPILHHPLLGAGSGGFDPAVRAEGTLPPNLTVLRAESLPVDLAAAVGLPAALVVLWLAGRWLLELRPHVRTAVAQYVAAFFALVGLAVHDLLDFALWLGAAGYYAALLAGWLAGAHAAAVNVHAVAPRGRGRVLALAAAAMSAVAGVLTAPGALYLDQGRADAAARGGALGEGDWRGAMTRHPGDPFLPLCAASWALRQGDPRALRFVGRALLLAPRWAEPHAMLAHVLAAHGLVAQALLEVRYAAGAEERAHAGLAPLVARLEPAPDALARAVPDGTIGVHFLQQIAAVARDRAFGERVDALLLARAPGDLGALQRSASRAHAGHDVAAEQRWLDRIVRAHPDESDGYVGLARLRLAAGDPEGAEAVLQAGMRRTQQPAMLLALAEVQTARRDGPAMRRTMQQLIELAGADCDQRTQMIGTLGAFERRLGAVGLAIAAFEQADGLAYPQHPYLIDVIEIAAQVGDQRRLRGACNTLRDEGEWDARARAACSGMDRAPPPLDPAAVGTAAEGED